MCISRIVVQDLTKAGAYMGKQRPGRTLVDSQIQNIKIALPNKRELVEWDPETQTLWLAETALNPPRMRVQSPKKKH